ncbi:serine/threonine-protein kinase [Nonomuraea sp. NPDC049421]|uniref:serine/threonine-protein kinase n=1 Tax=Nonomuraea sp. NPDC049421 TaxID=3155275 RepID=UPI0034369538
MQHSHPIRPSGLRWTAAVVWACLPLLTCGFATPFTVGFAAFWLRNVWHGVAACVYLVGMGSFTIAVLAYPNDDAPAELTVPVTLGLLLSWVGGVIHSGILVPFMAKARMTAVFAPAVTRTPTPVPTPRPPADVRQRITAPSVHRPLGQPQWIGHYRVERQLGRGGQGAVYLAVAPNGVRVAVKVLHDLVDDVARTRFAREVEAARRVATFSTARVLDVNIGGQHAYIVSEYVDGPSLEQLVRKHGPRDEDGLTRLALSTAGALAAIHKAGVVHRDFKPSNVLIGHDGPRVIDFGIARALDQMTMTSGKMVGTPPYMSPEQLKGETVGPPSDVFSWAVTMVFAATGRPAFGEDTVPAVFNRVLNHSPDLSRLPAGLRDVVGACLSKQPTDRPSASDVMLAIVR